MREGGVRKRHGEWGLGNESAFLRETWSAVTAHNPDEKLCELASRRGVLLVADLTCDGQSLNDIVERLRRLARWPAVGIAVLQGRQMLPANFRDHAPNLLLAQYVSSGELATLMPWANLAFVEVGNIAEFAQAISSYNIPIVAVRSVNEFSSIQQSRIGCDTLQADLAPIGDFAGYVV